MREEAINQWLVSQRLAPLIIVFLDELRDFPFRRQIIKATNLKHK